MYPRFSQVSFDDSFLVSRSRSAPCESGVFLIEDDSCPDNYSSKNFRDVPASYLAVLETPLLQFAIRRDSKSSPCTLKDYNNISLTPSRRSHNFQIGLEIQEELARAKMKAGLQKGAFMPADKVKTHSFLASLEAWDFLLQ